MGFNSAFKGLRSALFWKVTQQIAVIPYRLFKNIFWTLHLRIILVGNQLDAQFLRYVYLNPLHVSSNTVLILRRTIVLIQHLV